MYTKWFFPVNCTISFFFLLSFVTSTLTNYETLAGCGNVLIMHHKSFIYFWPLICRMMKHRRVHVRAHEFPHQSVCVDRGLWRAEPKPGLIPHGQTRPKTDFTGLCLTMSRLEGDTALCGPDLCLDIGALWMLSGCNPRRPSEKHIVLPDAHIEIPEAGPAADSHSDRQTDRQRLKG